MLISIAAIFGLEIHQMNVKTIFLNGELDEEIYMEQPEGFSVPGQEQKVYKLVKSLYGLKQTLKQWHEKFDKEILSSGFKTNECDKCVYTKSTQKGFVILCLYVDDILIIGSNHEMIQSTKRVLSSRFDMKDLRVVDVIIGIKIYRTSEGYILSKTHYIEKILDKYIKGDLNVARTLVDLTLHLSNNTGSNVS